MFTILLPCLKKIINNCFTNMKNLPQPIPSLARFPSISISQQRSTYQTNRKEKTILVSSHIHVSIPSRFHRISRIIRIFHVLARILIVWQARAKPVAQILIYDVSRSLWTNPLKIDFLTHVIRINISSITSQKINIIKRNLDF